MLKTAVILMVSAGVAQAADCGGPVLTFIESAPRDRFELSVGPQDLRSVTVDLRGSAGQLIFDTADGGTGVQVFQPLRDEGGTQAGDVVDGAEVVRVTLTGAQADGMASGMAGGMAGGKAGGKAAFSIDVDDRLRASDLGQIRVTGGEMAGAKVSFETVDGTVIEAVFGADNRAVACR